MTLHICRDNHTERPWWPTDERMDIPPTKKVFTDCCYRRVPASETICRIRSQELPKGGWGDYQEVWRWDTEDGEIMERVNFKTFLSWYEPTLRVECHPDAGCKANPRKRLGMHLREPY